MATNLTTVEPLSCELVESARFCTQCGSRRDATDSFCCHCGSQLEVTAADLGSRLISPAQPLLARRWVVISILLVTGPIGLPALWFSPSFSRVTKVVGSVLYFGFTTVLPLALAWYWLDYAMQPLVEAFGVIDRR